MKIYDEDNNVVSSPNLETGCLIDEYSFNVDGSVEKITRYHEYTKLEIEEMNANEEANAEAAARDAFLDSAPNIQEQTDEAICELYEQNLAMQAETDEAITSLYEMILGGE